LAGWQKAATGFIQTRPSCCPLLQAADASQELGEDVLIEGELQQDLAAGSEEEGQEQVGSLLLLLAAAEPLHA
jgi:hypothetical protein